MLTGRKPQLLPLIKAITSGLRVVLFPLLHSQSRKLPYFASMNRPLIKCALWWYRTLPTGVRTQVVLTYVNIFGCNERLQFE
jgi:hypothetical protein